MGRILVIDDEAQIRAMLREGLELHGHEVVEASNGEEGVRIYGRQRADLVITDILMPEKEGLECIQELRRLDPAARVIAISGGTRLKPMDVLDVAKRLGARRTFWKPFDLVRVIAAVQEELEARPAA